MVRTENTRGTVIADLIIVIAVVAIVVATVKVSDKRRRAVRDRANQRAPAADADASQS